MSRFPFISLSLVAVALVDEVAILTTSLGDQFREHVASTDYPVYGGLAVLVVAGYIAVRTFEQNSHFVITRGPSGFRPRRF